MGIVRKILGPKSKYDKSIPYTYIAKETLIEGDDELCSYYYADTICGLVEYLNEKDILPKEVELFGVYRKKRIKLNKNICIDSAGNWLLRPNICRELEDYFEQTKDKLYKGHKELEKCLFDDRERQGEGSN